MPQTPRPRARLSYRTQGAGGIRRFVLKVAQYFPVDEIAGWPLISAALLALVWANSPWGASYDKLWATEFTLRVGLQTAKLDLQHVVNEFLMPLFFFVIGLEVKHELTLGRLSSWRTAAMPVCVGLGGMVVPATTYLALNAWGDGNPSGWAVPVATDIAFALAILVLLGDRVPAGLKTLTLAFAAVDDIGGVLAIAFFFSQGISWAPLIIAAMLVLLIVGLRQLYVQGVMVYALIGLGVLISTYASGVHTTIAGVVLGFVVSPQPIFKREDFIRRAEELLDDFRETHKVRTELERRKQKSREDFRRLESSLEKEESVLARLDSLTRGTETPIERAMLLANPWVSYLVLPLFALANSGLRISADAMAQAATSPVAWGVFAGLLVGKPIGILAGAYLAEKAKIASLPKGVDWWSLTGMSFLAGIGFTVSLFIAELAFRAPEQLNHAKIGILLATLLASVAGAFTLYLRPSGSNRG